MVFDLLILIQPTGIQTSNISIYNIQTSDNENSQTLSSKLAEWELILELTSFIRTFHYQTYHTQTSYIRIKQSSFPEKGRSKNA